MGSAHRFVGIDLGAGAIHVVTLVGDRDRLALDDARLLTPDTMDDLAPIAARATAIAIDAPAAPSLGCHRGDASLAPKWRTARCGEIALGQGAGIWVAWATPLAGTPTPGWMEVGYATWAACRAHGPEPLEVYPAGCFRRLNGGALPPRKTTATGLAARRALLGAHTATPAGFAMWSHDALDASVAAVTAAHHAWGRAQGHGHTAPGCDGSAIWLPARPPVDAGGAHRAG